jgi:HPt (histidine-containing phosphotransfer) domain-containing protein
VRLTELASALDQVHARNLRQTGPEASNAPRPQREAQLSRRLHEMFDGLDPSDAAPLRRRVIDAFLAEVPALIEQLSEQVATGDHHAVARVAHSLLGIAGNVGADLMADLSLTLEEGARAERLDEAADLVHQLDAEYRCVAASIVKA